MFVNKAFKFRIYPNKKQIELINKTIGCSRFVFNFFLGEQKNKDVYWYMVEEMVQNGQFPANNWKGKCLSKNETVKAIPKLKEHYPFLKEVDSIALQKSVENLADSYSDIIESRINIHALNQKRILFSLIPLNIQMEILQSYTIPLNCPNSVLSVLPKVEKSKDVF